jgi:cyanophycin synthetase
MVEQFGRGQQHRLLVVGDRMIAAACGEGEFVVGDGRQSVLELVDEANRNPLRGVNYTNQLSVLRLNHSAIDELTRQGLKPESVPEAGRRVLVQRIGDLTMDCTHRVHPDVAARAVLAAQTVGLDIAGLDVVAEDISRPLEEQRGMILEVNAGPSLSMHIAPLHGEPQPVGHAIVSLMYPEGRLATIPIALVTGTGDRSLVADWLARLLQSAGIHAGLATSQERCYGMHRMTDENWRDWSNLESLLMHKHLEAAVCESRPDQAARDGLASPRADVVIVTQNRVRSDGRWELDRAGILAALNSLSSTGTLIIATDDPDADLFAARHSGPICWIAASSGNERALRSEDVLVAQRGAIIAAHGPNRSWSSKFPDGAPLEQSASCIVPAVAASVIIGVSAGL